MAIMLMPYPCMFLSNIVCPCNIMTEFPITASSLLANSIPKIDAVLICISICVSCEVFFPLIQIIFHSDALIQYSSFSLSSNLW